MFSLLLLIAPVLVLAEESSLPSIVPQGGAYEEGDYQLDQLLLVGINVSKIILGVVGSLTLMMFVYAGIMMLISSGNTEQISKAKGILMAAVVGLIIVFASYAIISFVMSSLGITNWSGGTDFITSGP